MDIFLYILKWVAIVAGIYVAGVLFNLIIFIPICYRYDTDKNKFNNYEPSVAVYSFILPIIIFVLLIKWIFTSYEFMEIYLNYLKKFDKKNKTEE